MKIHIVFPHLLYVYTFLGLVIFQMVQLSFEKKMKPQTFDDRNWFHGFLQRPRRTNWRDKQMIDVSSTQNTTATSTNGAGSAN